MRVLCFWGLVFRMAELQVPHLGQQIHRHCGDNHDSAHGNSVVAHHIGQHHHCSHQGRGGIELGCVDLQGPLLRGVEAGSASAAMCVQVGNHQQGGMVRVAACNLVAYWLLSSRRSQ